MRWCEALVLIEMCPDYEDYSPSYMWNLYGNLIALFKNLWILTQSSIRILFIIRINKIGLITRIYKNQLSFIFIMFYEETLKRVQLFYLGKDFESLIHCSKYY